jgi:hypothetical protein
LGSSGSFMPDRSKDTEKFSEKEAQARFEAALRGALKTPPKPLKEKPKARDEKDRQSRGSKEK